MQLKKHSAVNSHETTYKQLVWLSAISALAMEPEDLNIYGQHHWNVKRQTYLLSFTQTLYKVKLSVQSILLNCQAANCQGNQAIKARNQRMDTESLTC